MDRLTGSVPAVPLSPDFQKIFRDYTLADPELDRPSEIDILCGVDLLAKILTGDNVPARDSLMGLGTVFGLVLVGSTSCLVTQLPPTTPVTLLTALPVHAHTPQPDVIEKFWRLEEVPPPVKSTPEERLAEKIYSETTVQLPDGRYEVNLPFRPDPPALGSSLDLARKRMLALERRFESNPKLAEKYRKYMIDFEKDGFMSPVPPNPSPEEAPKYFLAHHGVTKTTNGVTKLRCVFDGSAPSSTGVSLNDTLLAGPALQNDVRDVLLNFRAHPVVFACDIKQMYLRISVTETHRPYQCILWRAHPSEQLRAYYLNTVTFGINCSPFLAIRTLHQLARDHGHKYPNAAKILLESVYVDDVNGGGPTIRVAKEHLEELIALLALGGFFLRKWSASHPEILENLPADHLECPIIDENDESPRFSILGVQWAPKLDCFTYVINLKPHAATKRGILSMLASIYDVCGWIAPVTFTAKSLMQEIWKLKLSWDERVPDEIWQLWSNFCRELPALRKVLIPRCLYVSAEYFEVHGFCDASQLGYSALLYLRSSPSPDSEALVNLVTAKTKVAPLRQVTLPRLELCAADLLVQLFHATLPKLQEKFGAENFYAWSDNTTVLHWINTESHTLKTFIANRVARIQELENVTWRHVRSADNPADVATRPMVPSELPSNELWWHGPPWLSLPHSEWPEEPLGAPDLDAMEFKKEMAPPPALDALIALPRPTIIPDLSSWDKIVRVICYIFRFIHRSRKIPCCKGPLDLTEVRTAEIWIVKFIQAEHFSDDVKLLQREPNALCSLRTQKLTPFLDKDGLLRVGGRLHNADITLNARHPLLLPCKDKLVRLLVEKYHAVNLHPGPQLLQALISQKYWVLAGRSLFRSVVHKCVHCFRARPSNAVPLMGSLPAPRVQPSAPFERTGVDYAGPFSVKLHSNRTARTVPAYVSVFVCLVTKAVHLEVVDGLSTPEFIAALQRFIARRGNPCLIMSDNGTNFVGAANVFARIMKSADPALQEFFLKNNIRFENIPPSNPTSGGLWEAAVKSMKSHLKRTIGNERLYAAEFLTLICRIEAMMNSRPLTPMSSDPNDFRPLTPGHFLIGRPLCCPPEPIYFDQDMSRLRRWELVNGMFQAIWRRWSVEYMHTLQPRGKWVKEAPNLEVGTLVLIKDDNLPPLEWKLGRVLDVYPGKDKRVRVASVKTISGTYERPVLKLYPLPQQD
ncbi:uncharacterized protein [Bemisia tabaci]|uniref:uncharacterized protein n=1 Tax=Bemisia tabaci TaxID=7038 RepID=UPI003B28511A